MRQFQMRASNVFWRFRWNMSDRSPTVLFSHPAIGTNIFFTLNEVREMAEKKESGKFLRIPLQVIEMALIEYEKACQSTQAA